MTAERSPGYEEALADPSTVYASPEDVLEQQGFSVAQKIEVLRRWAYDADELAVAQEEGMRCDEGSLLRRVLLALERLGAKIDLDDTPPTKQGGVADFAIRPGDESASG